MPPKDRRRFNDPSHTEQAQPQHPHQQRLTRRSARTRTLCETKSQPSQVNAAAVPSSEVVIIYVRISECRLGRLNLAEEIIGMIYGGNNSRFALRLVQIT